MKPEQERDQPRWSAPEYVTLESIVAVEHGRLPIHEAVVKDIMATITPRASPIADQAAQGAL